MKTADQCFRDNGADWTWDDRIGLGIGDPRKPLTPQTYRALEIIRAQRSASYKEVAEKMGVAMSTARHHIGWLQLHGYVCFVRGAHRSLQALPPKGAADA